MTIPTEISGIDLIVGKARKAQRNYETDGSQQLFDLACQAVAWALMKPENNQMLSKYAVEETGLGNVKDKTQKNHNKTLGLMRDIKGVKAFGHVADEPEFGLSTYLRPKGVIAAIVPSTNPLATPVNNIINALKTGNSIIIAPSPKGAGALSKLLAFIHENIEKIGLNRDLVQMVPIPPSKAKTKRLMELADLLVVTGSPNNVRAGYSSGTPALGVGQGNVVTIIDETADLKQAAAKIAASKTFDNATSCSSENAVIILREVYENALRALEQEGGLLLDQTESDHLVSTHWNNGKITKALLAQDIEVIVKNLGLQERANSATKFLMVPTKEAGPEAMLSGEKMSQFFALYVVEDFDEAVTTALKIQNYQGAGHSLGLHSHDDERAHHLAMAAQTCRIIVNQAHCFATGGFFNNGLPFSLSMGCGSWGGNSIDDNLNWTHFVNKVKIVRVIEEDCPKLDDIFFEFWNSYQT
ncbi:MAG: aldehyde dehydrogenase family protein [Paracoccaceae bacterium]|nr:aldehyde dehydrogenase family protein [Paracoccaceae bacterium]